MTTINTNIHIQIDPVQPIDPQNTDTTSANPTQPSTTPNTTGTDSFTPGSNDIPTPINNNQVIEQTPYQMLDQYQTVQLYTPQAVHNPYSSNNPVLATQYYMPGQSLYPTSPQQQYYIPGQSPYPQQQYYMPGQSFYPQQQYYMPGQSLYPQQQYYMPGQSLYPTSPQFFFPQQPAFPFNQIHLNLPLILGDQSGFRSVSTQYPYYNNSFQSAFAPPTVQNVLQNNPTLAYLLNGDPAITDRIDYSGNYLERLRAWIQSPRFQINTNEPSLASQLSELLTATLNAPSTSATINGRHTSLLNYNGVSNSLTSSLINQFNNPQNLNIVSLVVEPLLRALNIIRFEGNLDQTFADRFLGSTTEFGTLTQRIQQASTMTENPNGTQAADILQESTTNLSNAALGG